MRKRMGLLIMTVLLVIILARAVVGPSINNYAVKAQEETLLAAAIPDTITALDSMATVQYSYRDGKIVGWVALFLKSGLKAEAVKAYYDGYRFWEVPRDGSLYPNPIEEIWFDGLNDLEENVNYYIVYKKVALPTQIDWRWE